MTKTKMNKNLIIQLLTEEVERLKAVNENGTDMLDRMFDELRDVKHENDQLIQTNTILNHEIGEASQNAYDVANRLSDQLHDAHQEARNAETKLRNSTIDLHELRFLLTPDHVRQEKIKAIRIVRKITDCGIREAKNFVEAYIDDAQDDEPNDLGGILASALKQ